VLAIMVSAQIILIKTALKRLFLLLMLLLLLKMQHAF
jgi:hypothetical protein